MIYHSRYKGFQQINMSEIKRRKIMMKYFMPLNPESRNYNNSAKIAYLMIISLHSPKATGKCIGNHPVLKFNNGYPKASSDDSNLQLSK